MVTISPMVTIPPGVDLKNLVHDPVRKGTWRDLSTGINWKLGVDTMEELVGSLPIAGSDEEDHTPPSLPRRESGEIRVRLEKMEAPLPESGSVPESNDVPEADDSDALDSLEPTHVVVAEDGTATLAVETVSPKNGKSYFNRWMNGKKGPMVGTKGMDILPYDEDVEWQVARYDPERVPDDMEKITPSELRRHLLTSMGLLEG